MTVLCMPPDDEFTGPPDGGNLRVRWDEGEGSAHQRGPSLLYRFPSSLGPNVGKEPRFHGRSQERKRSQDSLNRSVHLLAVSTLGFFLPLGFLAFPFFVGPQRG